MPTDTGTCRSCGAKIRWAVMESGKRNPLDPDPTPAGNIVMVGNESLRGRVLAGTEILAARERGDTLYLSHFATCPNSRQHRRSRSAARTGASGPPTPDPEVTPAPSLFDAQTGEAVWPALLFLAGVCAVVAAAIEGGAFWVFIAAASCLFAAAVAAAICEED